MFRFHVSAFVGSFARALLSLAVALKSLTSSQNLSHDFLFRCGCKMAKILCAVFCNCDVSASCPCAPVFQIKMPGSENARKILRRPPNFRGHGTGTGHARNNGRPANLYCDGKSKYSYFKVSLISENYSKYQRLTIK